MSFGELEDKINLSKPTLADHLEDLTNQEKVKKERHPEDGRGRIYRLNRIEDGPGAPLIRYLSKKLEEPLYPSRPETKDIQNLVTPGIVEISNKFVEKHDLEGVEEGSEVLYTVWAYQAERKLKEEVWTKENFQKFAKSGMGSNKIRKKVGQISKSQELKSYLRKLQSELFVIPLAEKRNLEKNFRKLESVLKKITSQSSFLTEKGESERQKYVGNLSGKLFFKLF